MAKPNGAPVDQIDELLNNLPIEEEFLIATCSQNILKGYHWGFMTKELVKTYGKSLQQEFNNKLTNVFKVKDVEGNARFLAEAKDVKEALKVLQKIPSLVDQKFITDYMKSIQANKKSFVDFIEKKKKKGFKGYVGAYSVNSTTTMTFKGQRHPAFQLTVLDLLDICNTVLGNNVAVFVNGKPYTPYALFKEFGDRNNFNKFIETLPVSDGATSLVLPIAFKG